MSERENKKPEPRVLRCDEWEDMLADALDEVLPAAEAAAFERHHRECVLCAQMLKENQQGRDWMKYLTVEPEVPADLLQKILARTSGQPGVAIPAAPVPALPAWRRTTLPAAVHAARQVTRQLLEPRLMMTVAMAFFSIALTLNLTGVNLSQIRAADLQPSRLRATLTRQYYSTNQQVTKYYENLRLVYEMEARVRELRRSTEAEPASAPSSRPSPNQNPRQPMRDGSGPSSTVPREQQEPEQFYRPRVEPEPASFDRDRGTPKVKREVFRAFRSMTEDQAERSLV
jgi:hypothetical protein